VIGTCRAMLCTLTPAVELTPFSAFSAGSPNVACKVGDRSQVSQVKDRT